MRVDGFYWVKKRSIHSKFVDMDFAWEPAKFENLDEDGGLWSLHAMDHPYEDEDFEDIDERPIFRIAHLRALPQA